MSDLHLDGGHGDWDFGASANGLVEKELNLEAVKYQKKRFEELGVDISTTRLDDSGYESVARTNIVKDSGAGICISNHFNAGGGIGCETIHSIYSDGKLANMIADALVEAGEPLRRVFTRKGSNGLDYYYMHRMTGSVETIIVEYAFLDSDEDYARIKDKNFRTKEYEAVVKAICEYMGVKYVVPNGDKEESAPKQEDENEKVETVVQVVDENVGNYRIESKVADLRFYNAPSWEDTDFVNYIDKGIGFPTVVKKLKVDGGHQYEVKNSNGSIFYVTAAEKFVDLIKKEEPKPSYVGKRVESHHEGDLRFYDKPSWDDADVAGHFQKGYGFPNIIEKVKVEDGYQFKTENSEGDVFYVTANEKFVHVK